MQTILDEKIELLLKECKCNQCTLPCAKRIHKAFQDRIKELEDEIARMKSDEILQPLLE
jgi:hypothetical protein